MTLRITVENHFYGQSAEEVQYIMQNLTDAMDGMLTANTDMITLAFILLSLVEQDAVDTVSVSRDDGCGYTFKVTYRAGAGVRTVITAAWTAEDTGTSMIGDIMDSLSAAELMDIMAWRGVAGKEARNG